MEQKYEQAQERFVASKRELEEVRRRAVCAMIERGAGRAAARGSVIVGRLCSTTARCCACALEIRTLFIYAGDTAGTAGGLPIAASLHLATKSARKLASSPYRRTLIA